MAASASPVESEAGDVFALELAGAFHHHLLNLIGTASGWLQLAESGEASGFAQPLGGALDAAVAGTRRQALIIEALAGRIRPSAQPMLLDAAIEAVGRRARCRVCCSQLPQVRADAEVLPYVLELCLERCGEDAVVRSVDGVPGEVLEITIERPAESRDRDVTRDGRWGALCRGQGVLILADAAGVKLSLGDNGSSTLRCAVDRGGAP